MKAALLIVLSLSAMAFAGPAFTKDNQIGTQQQQQQTYMTGDAKSPAIEVLKQWCFSSQMSQQELTASFKKLVGVVKSSPIDQATEAAVMNERICQGALVQKSQQSGQTVGQSGADAKAHELIKDVYMDALISCKSHQCTEQLLKIISSQQVDTIRASYYMTRIAVSDKQTLTDEQQIKQFADSLVQQSQSQSQSEAVERQQLFATTALIGKWIQTKPIDEQMKQLANQVAKTIVERYVKPVGEHEIEQYKQASAGQQQPPTELAKKVAKRGAALKALANIPGHVLKQIASAHEIEQTLVSIAQNKRELSTARQSAIECLEQNDKQMAPLKQLAFDQDEPIEVRVAAYRALMTLAYQGDDKTDEAAKEQMAAQIVDEIVKHCEDARNQQADEQFVLYAVSHLDNVRSSQQPEQRAIKETIAKNKQHYMQIQVLSKKFAQQLGDVRRSSRNYKLEQEFNQLESGLVLEGDLIYESKQHKTQQQQQQQQQQQHNILPKLVRVNMSMPIMGATVNVIELTLRQNQMDEEILSALKLVQNTKFSSESVSKVVDSFKSSVEKQQQQQQQQNEYKNQNQNQNQNKNTYELPVEADLTIKVDGCTVVYLCVDDIKASSGAIKSAAAGSTRNTRSVYSSSSIVDDVIEFLKRQPVNFNRGFNVNINERLAKVLDVDANILAGLRFESRAQGSARQGDFELAIQMEPRFSFEAVVGPAKVSSKKLLQRVSTKTALGLRLRFKRDELIDVAIELPMNNMELFTIETQLVEKTARSVPYSYNYLPESIYGDEDIYASYPIYSAADYTSKLAKRSIASAFGVKKSGIASTLLQGKPIAHSYETSEQIARATGLRGKLRVAAAPKDMSLLVSAIVQKYEPQMQGYRVKVEKSQRSGEQRQYVLTVTSPNSRHERTLAVRVATQSGAARTVVKCEVQAPRMAFAASAEIVHDAGRQYGAKAELVSRDARKQWRHTADAGIVLGTHATAGRLAQFSCKPYVQLDSTYLKRPIALQGLMAYQQAPKSVISYELKCATTGDFVQGKLIVEQRDAKSAFARRSAMPARRSMQSPLTLLLTKDLTFTNELVAQLDKHAVKAHTMADWECQQFALKADSSLVYKNLRKSTQESRLSASMKLDQEQQVFIVERKCAGNSRNDFVARLSSRVLPSGHQMELESRRPGSQQMYAYKHKIEATKTPAEIALSGQIELVDTERAINEKLAGRARVKSERALTSVEAELSGAGGKQAKMSLDFSSLAKHQLVVVLQCERFQHKCELRNGPRQFVLQSRTDNKQSGQTSAKLMIELSKPELEGKFACEWPAKRIAASADIKLGSGKRSSVAVQSGRFATQAEFSFETYARQFADAHSIMRYLTPFQKPSSMRFRSSLKDLASKQAYWLDSALSSDAEADSFVRFDSPYYRTDLEFSPRELEAKLGAFARAKRSVDNYDSLYSTKDSAVFGLGSEQLGATSVADKLKLGADKMWMMRSIVASPFARDALKQKARRALFEYADRRQSQAHSFNWSPSEERVSMELSRGPNGEFVSAGAGAFEPMRAKADLSTSWARPSSMSIESDWMSADFETKPFDELESYAKLSAVSRHPRSPFKKHESEFRASKADGYKAWMKHQDAHGKRSSLAMHADASPSKWAKLSYEADKHGKRSWEHQWRKQQSTRAHGQEPVYANKFALSGEGPAGSEWKHETRFDWDEPVRMAKIAGGKHYRARRSYGTYSAYGALADKLFAAGAKYAPIEYAKHSNARLVSSTRYPGAQQPAYKLDFDYQPQQNVARLNVDLDDMLHASEFSMKPSESLYKLSSKYYNRVSGEPSYEFVAATKPYGLASGEQEPMFVDAEHEMYERPISKSSLAYTLFKQPMKLDYSDKYGRVASVDYDASPVDIAAAKYAGLRQKRAAIYYKDGPGAFEHSTSYDFYPESYMTTMKPSHYAAKQQQQQQQQQPGNVAFKTQTKYGPMIVRVDSTDATCLVDVQTPVVSAKLIGETGANMRKLFKVQLDNKSQRVQLAKLLRDAPASIRELQLVKKIARKFDAGRFEHQSELLVSIVDQIFKIKSASKFNERPVLVIEGEWDAQQEKAFAKINGERVLGQAVVDLVRNSADLVIDIDDKRTMHHVTRIVRTSDQFYSLESLTSHKSRPVFKLIGKLSAMIFDPEHLFARRQYLEQPQQQQPAHVSTFEAIVYEPKEYHVSGQFDCDKKEARMVFKSAEEHKIQETFVRFDESTQTVHFDSRLSSPIEGQIYATKGKINLPGLYQSDECQAYGSGNKFGADQKYGQIFASKIGAGPHSCQSDWIFSDKSGNWSAKYAPGDYVTVSTPRAKQTINLAGYYY